MANSIFGSIGFSNNENDHENSTSENSTFRNSTSGTIYKNGNQIAEDGTNIEYKPITKGPQEVKKLQLTPEKKEIRKQAKSAKKKATKLEVAEKKEARKENKKDRSVDKKGLRKKVQENRNSY